MSKNKYCGNCKHFKDEDAEGWGWCSFNKTKTHCAQSCDCHNSTFNGWTEITSDNMNEVDCIDQEKVVIGWLDNKGRQHIAALVDCPPVKSSLAGRGYYYYVLPELKIE